VILITLVAIGLGLESSVDSTLAAATAHSANLAVYPAWQGYQSVTYCTEAGDELAMSLFAPTATDHRVPVIIQVHGGGWRNGARLVPPLDPKSITAGLVDAGFAVASIDYRMQPDHTWPAPMQDLTCAVRYLHSHADALGLDANRIGAWGESAGGQLVGLLGTDPDGPAWNSGEYAGVSNHVQAVVDEFGPSDLTATGWSDQVADDIHGEFSNASAQDPNPLVDASPINHVATGDPPFLLLHGTNDIQVPVTQSERFADRLRASGDDVTLVLVQGGEHGLFNAGEVPRPSGIQDLIVQFFTDKLMH
jgi:acetyl esterase/lipase